MDDASPVIAAVVTAAIIGVFWLAGDPATPTPANQSNEQVIAGMIPGTRSAADVYAVEAGIDRDWVRIVYRVRFVDRQCTVLLGNGRAVMCGEGAFAATTPGVATP